MRITERNPFCRKKSYGFFVSSCSHFAYDFLHFVRLLNTEQQIFVWFFSWKSFFFLFFFFIIGPFFPIFSDNLRVLLVNFKCVLMVRRNCMTNSKKRVWCTNKNIIKLWRNLNGTSSFQKAKKKKELFYLYNGTAIKKIPFFQWTDEQVN